MWCAPHSAVRPRGRSQRHAMSFRPRFSIRSRLLCLSTIRCQTLPARLTARRTIIFPTSSGTRNTGPGLRASITRLALASRSLGSTTTASIPRIATTGRPTFPAASSTALRLPKDSRTGPMMAATLITRTCFLQRPCSIFVSALISSPRSGIRRWPSILQRFHFQRRRSQPFVVISIFR